MTGKSEFNIAIGVLKIASARKDGLATFNRLRKEIPNVVKLDATELASSKTRNGEPLWHQIVRNIKSHDSDDGNFIDLGLLKHVPRVGYIITEHGRKFLKSKGF